MYAVSTCARCTQAFQQLAEKKLISEKSFKKTWSGAPIFEVFPRFVRYPRTPYVRPRVQKSVRTPIRAGI